MKKLSVIEKMNEVVKTLPGSGYKMGDLFTLTVNDITVTHDARQYYSGRGAKYNASIRHGNITVNMTESELNSAYKPISERIKKDIAAKKRMQKYLANCNKPKQIALLAAERVKVVGKSGYIGPGSIVTRDGRLLHDKKDGCFMSYDAKINLETLELIRIYDKEYELSELKTVSYHIANTGELKQLDELIIKNTPIDVYSGCGVYRVGWRNNKITCALYGGFHDSCPYGVDKEKWQRAVIKEMKKYADHIVKMDGSGTQFFFRNIEDADLVTNAVEIYNVPSAYGGWHTNIQPADAEILNPKSLTNG